MLKEKKHMCNRNRHCGCRCGCRHGGSGNPCSPNPQNAEFNRVVATWQTVRHYKIQSHDTLVPVCTRGLGDENFEQSLGGGAGDDSEGCGCNG